MNTQSLMISSGEKISLVSNLATMLTSGIPILEAVDSLLEDAKGNQKKILEILKSDLIGGNRIFTTFAKFPMVFDKVTTNVVRAAEEAGTLDVTLKDLKATIEKEVEFTDKIKSALLYPSFIVIVFFAVLFLILIVVIPKIAEVFGRLRMELPLPTRVLIFASNVILKHTLWVMLAAAGLVLGSLFLYRSQRKLFLNFFFSLPFINTLVKEVDLTRFSRSLSLLLYAGIPITTALELTSDVVIKRDTARVIAKSREMVLAGRPLSEGLRNTRGFVPAIMMKLIEAGEKTGTLDRSMQDISVYYDYQVSNSLKIITALIEPIMLVGIGFIVGSMMLAIVTPIYGLIGQVGAR